MQRLPGKERGDVPGGIVDKNSPANTGDLGVGRSRIPQSK